MAQAALQNSRRKPKRVRPLLEPTVEAGQAEGVEAAANGIQDTEKQANGHPANSKFARALGSVDYHTREKGLQALTRWLTRHRSLTSTDLLKVWKGLFYCFWHSDKAPVQAELAERLAAIMPALGDEAMYLFFEAFLRTMRREWFGIDRLRLDKFMMLTRVFFRQALEVLRARQWSTPAVAHYAELLRSQVLMPNDHLHAVGFTYHLCDLVVPELCKVAAGSSTSGGKPQPAPAAAISVLLEPFAQFMASTAEQSAITRVRGSVFADLLEELQSSREDDDEGQAGTAPLALLDVAQLASHLFDLGALPGLKARNREALYEVSKQLEQLNRKRRKAAGEPDVAAAAAPSAAVPAVKGASKTSTPPETAAGEVKKSKRPKVGQIIGSWAAPVGASGLPGVDAVVDPATAAAAPTAAAAAQVAAAGGTAAAASGPNKRQRVKDKKAQQQPAAAAGDLTAGDATTGTEEQATAAAQANGQSSGKKSKKQRAAAAAAAAGQEAVASEREGAAPGVEEPSAPVASISGRDPSAVMSSKKRRPFPVATAAADVSGGTPATDAPDALLPSTSAAAAAGGRGVGPLAAALAAKREAALASRPSSAKSTPVAAAANGAAAAAGRTGAAPGSALNASASQQAAPSATASGLRGVGADAAAPSEASAVATTAQKKAVMINLRRNLYFAVGGPKPHPDVRTPPTARSKGSILKKTSMLARKVSSAPAKQGGGGAGRGGGGGGGRGSGGGRGRGPPPQVHMSVAMANAQLRQQQLQRRSSTGQPQPRQQQAGTPGGPGPSRLRTNTALNF